MRARVAVTICAGLLAGALPLVAPAQTSSATTRTLVYVYESRVASGAAGPDNGERPAGEIAPDDCLSGGLKVAGRMSSAVAAGNGGIDWFQVDCTSGFGYHVGNSGVSEHGTISIAVQRRQSDGPVVLGVSEQSAKPATCVVYPTTAFICDPNAQISLEETMLLRFLAPDFVDPSAPIGRHWEVADQSPQSSFKATYTVLHGAAGDMTIGVRRTATGDAGPHSSAETNAVLLYDTKRAVPTAIDESLVQKIFRSGRYLTNAQETVFRLQSASLLDTHL